MKRSPTILTRIFVRFVKWYQFARGTIYPIKTCRFYPSCSQYAVESTQKYGFFTGGAKAIIRVLKCSPLCDGGFDPVK